MNLDLNSLNGTLSVANSALMASKIADEVERNQRLAATMARQSAARDATLVAGAEASIEQKELLQQQLEIIREQNALLCDNYEKLKEMYDAQVQENESAKEELKRSRRYNAWMMVIAIFAMFAAIAGPIATILVSQ